MNASGDEVASDFHPLLLHLFIKMTAKQLEIVRMTRGDQEKEVYSDIGDTTHLAQTILDQPVRRFHFKRR